MISVMTEGSPGTTLPDELLAHAARRTLQHEAAAITPLMGDAAQAELSIVQTDDLHIRTLNRHYLGQNTATDVLAFPSEESDPDSGARYLGDVLISIPRAAEQAAVAGHSLEAEAQLLVVHGVLHLLGHDHTVAADKARMWAAQAEILGELGLGGINVRET